MNPLQRALIEKAGHDNGFEHVLPIDGPQVGLGSARHPAQVTVTASEDGFRVTIKSGAATLAQELARTYLLAANAGQGFVLPSEAALAQWLRRAAALSKALPNQAVMAFEAQLQSELSAMPVAAAQNTEVQRMVRQRVGQQAYRQAMLGYWGGACAVIDGVPNVSSTSASRELPKVFTVLSSVGPRRWTIPAGKSPEMIGE